MEEFYRLNPLVTCSENDAVRVGNVSASSAAALTPAELFHGPVAKKYLQLEASEPDVTGSDICDGLIKTQIANHPLYPNLVSAYIECQKVGAPPELASLLEEIGRENNPMIARQDTRDDPELDEFMESYCQVLHMYKEELSKPFEEATSFLSDITSQFTNLCKGTLTKSSDIRSDEVAGTSEEELSCGEVEALENNEFCSSGAGDQELKEMLLRKYSGYLSSLRKDFLKKRKKGKLPKDARTALLDWWNTHYKWPYPTDEEKMKLSEMTGLGHKQINNWFINQRKRHWKPSEDMRFAVMEDATGGNLGGGGPIYFDSGGATHQSGGVSKFASPF